MPNDFKGTLLQNIAGESPEAIDWAVDASVKEFVEHEFGTASPKTLLVFERKATSLYQSSLVTLLQRGNTLVGIRRFENAVWTKSATLPKNVSLLTDCINTGKEISNIVSFLKTHEKVTIDGIYAYVANGIAVNRLKKYDLTKNIPLHIGQELKGRTLQTLFRRLEAYYQSHIEPLDSDHSHDVYQVSQSLTEDKLREITEKGCQDALGIDRLKFENDENLFVPQNLKSMSLDIIDLNRIENLALKSNLQQIMKFKFEFPQIRLKANLGEYGTQFSIMGCFPPVDLTLAKIKKNECFVKTKTICYNDAFGGDLPLSKKKLILCSLCLENYVSRTILNKIAESLLPLLRIDEKSPEKTSDAEIVQKYDPVFRSL